MIMYSRLFVVMRNKRNPFTGIHNNQIGLKDKSKTKLKLPRSAEPRRRRGEQWLTSRRNRWCTVRQRHAVDADGIVGKVLVAVARDVESLYGKVHAARLTKFESF